MPSLHLNFHRPAPVAVTDNRKSLIILVQDDRIHTALQDASYSIDDFAHNSDEIHRHMMTAQPINIYCLAESYGVRELATEPFSAERLEAIQQNTGAYKNFHVTKMKNGSLLTLSYTPNGVTLSSTADARAVNEPQQHPRWF